MALTIPDQGEAANDRQSILFQSQIDAIVAGAVRTGVMTGCAVAQRAAGANMTVDVAAGGVSVNGVPKSVASTNVAIGAADATNPRIDLVVCNGSGTVSVLAGTAAASPKAPTLDTTTYALLAVIDVPATQTAINTAQITDGRIILSPTIYPGTSTPMGLLGQTTGWWDIRDFGAKCDLRASEAGCSSTAGSPNVTVTDAHFTSADVGKQFFLSQGTNSTTGFKSTISSVTDATHVVLAANVTATTSAKSALWGTDDTVAIQAALDAAYSAANTEPAGGGGSGTVFFPGWSYVNGAVNPGSNTNNNSVLCVPSAPITYTGGTVSGSQRQPSIRILGSGPPSEVYSTIAPTMGGSGVFCPTAGANTNSSIIGGGYVVTANTFFSLELTVENMHVMSVNNPSIIGIDGRNLQGLVVRNVTVGIGIPRNESTAGGSTFGIRWPFITNGAVACRAEGNVLVHRFDGGINTGEHFVNAGNIHLQGGTNGVTLGGGAAHAQHLGSICLQQFSGSLVNTTGSGPFYVSADQLRCELGSATWFVNDSAGNIRGIIPFAFANTINDAPPVNSPAGGPTVKLFNIHIPLGSYSWTLPATTVDSTPVYRDLMLSFTGGTVTAITVGGVTINPAATTFLVPSGKKVNVTYSSAPTVTAQAL